MGTGLISTIQHRSPDEAKRNPGRSRPRIPLRSMRATGCCALLTPLQRQRNPLPHADAHGGERALAAALLERVQRRQGEARARHAERMAERDRAAAPLTVLP